MFRKALATSLLMTGAFSAQAGVMYDVGNKVTGAIAAPNYGLRLDNLFGSGSGHWTFDFEENAGTNVTMTIDGGIVNISGTVYGGRDIGASWAAGTEAHWALDFTYDTNVNITNPTTGEFRANWMNTTALNFGTLTLLDDIDLDGNGSDVNRVIGLGDYKGAGLVLANTGRQFEGWLRTTAGFVGAPKNSSFDADDLQAKNGCCQDFGATVTAVPEPGSLALIALGLIGLGAARYKQQ